MRILAIDPGTTQSAFVIYNTYEKTIIEKNIFLNIDTRSYPKNKYDVLVIEQIKSYGNIMGDSVLETCVWTGRFIEIFKSKATSKHSILIPRKTITTAVCGTSRAKDKNVRQAIIDYFREHKKEDDVIGTKKNPKYLYGIKRDLWSALAVAIAFDSGLSRNNT